MSLREDVEAEALAANRALASLTDAGVAAALRTAGELVRARRAEILAANRTDVEAAAGRLDEGTLDRLRLDESRVEALAAQVGVMAEL